MYGLEYVYANISSNSNFPECPKMKNRQRQIWKLGWNREENVGQGWLTHRTGWRAQVKRRLI